MKIAVENKRIVTNSEGAKIAAKNNFLLMASNGLTQEFKKTHSDYIIAVLVITGINGKKGV